jgi:signal transduction histidine kinase
MSARDASETETWLLSVPPTARQTRWAIAVAACLVVALALIGPFARVQLAQVDGFIPAFEGVIFITDLITCILLFSQFAIYHSRALLVLACGYLFTAMMIIPHALTFPGAFSPAGLLGAGLQTTAWLYWFWHLVFPIALLVYGLTKEEKLARRLSHVSPSIVIGRSVALVVAFALVLTLLATAGDAYMPKLFVDKVTVAPLNKVVGAVTTVACVSALVVLWLRRSSMLDQWLMIVALAAILEMGLAVIFVSGRFSLGFYVGRIFPLLTSTVVLAVLLVETARLYARVARSNMILQREQNNRLMNLEAMTASIAHEVRQPLTALVANAAAAQLFIRRAQPALQEAQDCLQEVIESGHRVSEVFDNIRSLFRKGSWQQEPVDLGLLTQRVLAAFLDEFNRHQIATRIELASDLPVVIGHGGQLQEVVFNLVQNAIEAMDGTEAGGRVLQVRTGLDGGAIALTVEDSGPGFGTTDPDAIFDRFISTKPGGMGLGLAICRMIIERHGGRITAAAAHPHGAVFRVDLPAAAPRDAARAAAPAQAAARLETT